MLRAKVLQGVDNGNRYTVLFEEGDISNPTKIMTEYPTQTLMWDLFDCLPDHMQEQFIKEIKAIKG